MRLEPVSHAEGDGLQTDVMRFMAIIAFCLIAVLALVRNAQPAGLQTTQIAEPAEVPVPVAEPRPTPSPARLQPKPRVETLPPVQTPAKIETPEKAPGAPRGLALRFASDRDFLRLIETGRVRVFAFQPQDPGRTALGLGRNLEFVATPPPERIYELQVDTIPSRVIASLARATGNPAGFSWGVRMPVELEASIRSWIERGVVGELIIDRYAEVRHVSG
ncbi:MAG: hypothetical protein GWM88_10915 [Pseudomonadales bacterium]|nr:hypothetical protein [Pseudomonadales bacterium]NIX08480.1 hypothetical protein [Pseudomonadales bacterium]